MPHHFRNDSWAGIESGQQESTGFSVKRVKRRRRMPRVRWNTIKTIGVAGFFLLAIIGAIFGDDDEHHHGTVSIPSYSVPNLPSFSSDLENGPEYVPGSGWRDLHKAITAFDRSSRSEFGIRRITVIGDDSIDIEYPSGSKDGPSLNVGWKVSTQTMVKDDGPTTSAGDPVFKGRQVDVAKLRAQAEQVKRMTDTPGLPNVYIEANANGDGVDYQFQTEEDQPRYYRVDADGKLKLDD